MKIEYGPDKLLKQMYYLRELWFLKEESKQKLDLIYLYYLRKDYCSSSLPDILDKAIQNNLQEQMKAPVTIMSNVIAYTIDRDFLEKRLREYSRSVKPLDISINFKDENVGDAFLYSTKMFLNSPDNVIWSTIWPQTNISTSSIFASSEKKFLQDCIKSMMDVKLLTTLK